MYIILLVFFFHSIKLTFCVNHFIFYSVPHIHASLWEAILFNIFCRCPSSVFSHVLLCPLCLLYPCIPWPSSSCISQLLVTFNLTFHANLCLPSIKIFPLSSSFPVPSPVCHSKHFTFISISSYS